MRAVRHLLNPDGEASRALMVARAVTIAAAVVVGIAFVLSGLAAAFPSTF